MLKKIIVLGLAILPLVVTAQVSINAQLPLAGMVDKEQLWNLILINNKEDILDVTVKLSLQDKATGQVVLSASSGNLLLGKGVKLVSSKDIQPVLYNYNDPNLSRNYLPMGAYVACYQVNINSSKAEPLGEECVQVNIEPLSPPLLNAPGDKTEIQTPYPQFNWMPPTPFDMFTNLNYDLIVTEVLDGQSPAEAIQYNLPLYSKNDITQPNESYPSSFSSLVPDKRYAWQVVAKNGLSYAAKTEVWTFKIAAPSFVQTIIEQSPFVKMKRDNPDKGVAPNGILKLSYKNETNDSSVIITIVDLNNRVNKGGLLKVHLDRGENLIQQDLQKFINTTEGGLYEASITNSRNEIWKVIFEVHKYQNKKTERK